MYLSFRILMERENKQRHKSSNYFNKINRQGDSEEGKLKHTALDDSAAFDVKALNAVCI